jgi:putative FmdB family regulatory protein
MPLYDYKCPTCGAVTEQTHSIKESPSIPCPECEKTGSTVVMERMISLNRNGFIVKGFTEAMSWKVKRDRMKNNAELGMKQIERYGNGTRLQPNVAGMETDSWSDAQKVAKEAGMNADSYEPLIEKEKSVSKISGVDDSKWKAAKAEAGKI